MQSVRLKWTVDQIKAVLRISQNQLFHVKYLDPRIPGHRAQPGELEAAESAIRVLEAALRKDRLSITYEIPARRGALPRLKQES